MLMGDRDALDGSPTQLCLDRLLPHTVVVRLFSPQGVHRLPSPLEVPAPGLPEQIAAELQYFLLH